MLIMIIHIQEARRLTRFTSKQIGMLLDGGKQFDSSREKKKPFQFKIGAGEVIKGWDVGVMKMSLGERAILTIPSDMG